MYTENFLDEIFPYISFPRKESGLFVGQIGSVKTIRVCGRYCVEVLPEFSDCEHPEVGLSGLETR